MPQPKPDAPATSTGRGKPPRAGRKGDPPAARRSAGTARSPGVVPSPATPPEAQAARDEALRANLIQLREVLAGGIMLTAQRVQETMDDAVRRGKMTRRDAEEIARGLMETGLRQSQEIITEIEALLGRGRSDLGSASGRMRQRTDRVLREVDRVRRSAGVGASFPIIGYDDLTAAQVTARLPDLTPADLRRVRSHERRNANRKTVLVALDRALG